MVGFRVVGGDVSDALALAVALESDGGLFVVLEDVVAGSFDVLAKVASQSAGTALMRLLTRAGHSSLALV